MVVHCIVFSEFIITLQKQHVHRPFPHTLRNGWQCKGNSTHTHQSSQKLLCQVELWQELIAEIKRLLGSLDLLYLTFTSTVPKNNWFAWGKKEPEALRSLTVPGLSHPTKALR